MSATNAMIDILRRGGVAPPRPGAETATLHETAFFRDREMFGALRENVFPELIARNAATQKLSVLCAGVATGQEAYSVAMVLRESFGEQLAGWEVKIVGVDRVRSVVDCAARGRYRRAEVNRGLPAKLLLKYFVRDEEEWEVVPQLRAICKFSDADVCKLAADARRFDLVLMRNLLLLLSGQERVAAFGSMRDQMAPHGVLALGAAEQAEDSTDLFEAEYLQGYCFYRAAKHG